MCLHLRDTLKRFQRADEDATTDTRDFSADVQHEVVAIAEIDVSVAAAEEHGAISRGGSDVVVRGGVANGVSLSFHDAASQAAFRQFANDDFADEKARQGFGIDGKFGASKAPEAQRDVLVGHGSDASIAGIGKRFCFGELRAKSFGSERSRVGQLSSLIGETRSRVRNTILRTARSLVNPSSEPSQDKSQFLKQKPVAASAAASSVAANESALVCAARAEGATASAQSERRRVERTRTDQLLYVELGTGNGGVLRDVSEEGCGFLSIAPIWDQEPRFAFGIGGGRQIQGEGKIIWVDSSRKLGGLRFLDGSPAFRERVRAWLAEPKAVVGQPEQKAESKADSHTEIFKPIESKPIRVPSDAQADSPAKQRRKQLREEARAKMEAAERERASGFRGESQAIGEDAGPKQQGSIGGMHEEIFLHGPGERTWPAFVRNQKLWKGLAGFALGGAIAVLSVAYRQEAGALLMRLGTSLAGRQQQVASANESSAAPTAPRQVQAGSAEKAESVVGEEVERKSETLNNAADEPQLKQAAPAAVVTQSNGEGRFGKEEPGVIQKLSSDAQQTTSAAAGETPAPKMLETKKKKPHHATAEQVQALWSEVEGGDVSAEVALGELYARGNGVPKSCGQARMLLNSAAKKGSEEARQKLEQLGDEGCP
jgi:hypothetical protein